MSGRIIPRPRFADDDGSADPRLAATLLAYAQGRAGEHQVLTAFAETRLLVPVVAVRAAEVGAADPQTGGEEGGPHREPQEKESDMALPTLLGQDGRRGVLGFTSSETLKRWRPDTRPVAVRARDACRATLDEAADALVVDVAGPVPFAVEGNRLFTFAEERPVPRPHQDPDLLAGELRGRIVGGVEVGVIRR